MVKTATTPTPEDGKEINAEMLAALLRSLRLWRMADTLPAILDEAAREGWGNLEFLAKILRSEDARRCQSRFERNLKASGLTLAYGLDHFDFEMGADVFEHTYLMRLGQAVAVAPAARSRSDGTSSPAELAQ